MRVLFACEKSKKILKKDKNNIFHTYLKHISQTHNKNVILIPDNIDDNLIKICFYKLYISTKIMQNLKSKPISKIIIKLSKVYIDF